MYKLGITTMYYFPSHFSLWSFLFGVYFVAEVLLGYMEFIIFTGFAHRIIIIITCVRVLIIIIKLDEELVYFLMDFSAFVMKRGIEVEKV